MAIPALFAGRQRSSGPQIVGHHAEAVTGGSEFYDLGSLIGTAVGDRIVVVASGEGPYDYTTGDFPYGWGTSSAPLTFIADVTGSLFQPASRYTSVYIASWIVDNSNNNLLAAVEGYQSTGTSMMVYGIRGAANLTSISLTGSNYSTPSVPSRSATNGGIVLSGASSSYSTYNSPAYYTVNSGVANYEGFTTYGSSSNNIVGGGYGFVGTNTSTATYTLNNVLNEAGNSHVEFTMEAY